MDRRKTISLAMCVALVGGVGVGCSDLPGDKESQGAVIGGVTGAAAGAILGGEDNRLLGALIGGAAGAGGGWLIGSQLEKADEDDREDAIQAAQRAERNPATAEQARSARTADINGDGYVTMDEVVALDQAGLSDDEIIQRLERTDMFFDLSQRQQQYLRDRGVSDRVVREMNNVNADVRRQAEQRLQERERDTSSQSIGRQR